MFSEGQPVVVDRSCSDRTNTEVGDRDGKRIWNRARWSWQRRNAPADRWRLERTAATTAADPQAVSTIEAAEEQTLIDLSPRTDARTWMRRLDAYRQPRPLRAIFELATTIIPFAALWAAMIAAIGAGAWWLYLLLILPTAGLLVRLFMIQHDCGHGSFLASRVCNDWIGRMIGVLTLTPYDYWQRAHAVHHASSGHLDRRGIGDVDTLTTDEYLALSRWGQFKYRLYRNPIVMFGIGPVYLFVLQNRLPLGFMRKGWTPWVSTMATNVALVAASAILIWTVGLSSFLLVHVPVVLIAAAAGVWLFYVQHQFEETHWDHAPAWSFHEAALNGSSFYDLPPVLRWFTANIGIHHVHHLASRVPFYRLTEVLRDFPELRGISRLTLLQSFSCVRLVLWDEATRHMVPFRELRLLTASNGAPVHPQSI